MKCALRLRKAEMRTAEKSTADCDDDHCKRTMSRVRVILIQVSYIRFENNVKSKGIIRRIDTLYVSIRKYGIQVH